MKGGKKALPKIHFKALNAPRLSAEQLRMDLLLLIPSPGLRPERSPCPAGRPRAEHPRRQAGPAAGRPGRSPAARSRQEPPGAPPPAVSRPHRRRGRAAEGGPGRAAGGAGHGVTPGRPGAAEPLTHILVEGVGGEERHGGARGLGAATPPLPAARRPNDGPAAAPAAPPAGVAFASAAAAASQGSGASPPRAACREAGAGPTAPGSGPPRRTPTRLRGSGAPYGGRPSGSVRGPDCAWPPAAAGGSQGLSAAALRGCRRLPPPHASGSVEKRTQGSFIWFYFFVSRVRALLSVENVPSFVGLN